MSKQQKPERRRESNIAQIEVKVDDNNVRGLRDRAMLVRIPMGCWRGAGRDEAIAQDIAVKYDAKGKVGNFTKHYLVSDQLRKIYKVFSAARSYHKSMTLPWGDTGARLLPATSFFEYKKKMTAFETDFRLAVTTFMASYHEQVNAQKVRLGKSWKASDYPSDEAVRSEFRFAVVVEPIPVADDFRLKLSEVESKEIKSDYEAEVKLRMKDAVLDVFSSVRDTITELQEKLANPDAELRASSFAALQRLVARLPQLNSVVQDNNITALGNQIARDLLEVDVDAVAHDKGERSKAKSKADAILAALKPLQNSWTAGQAQ